MRPGMSVMPASLMVRAPAGDVLAAGPAPSMRWPRTTTTQPVCIFWPSNTRSATSASGAASGGPCACACPNANASSAIAVRHAVRVIGPPDPSVSICVYLRLSASICVHLRLSAAVSAAAILPDRECVRGLMKTTADVVIVGGGCMGASVAYHLAARGMTNVVLIEREAQLATGSTGRNAVVFLHQFSNAANIELSKESVALFAEFQHVV